MSRCQDAYDAHQRARFMRPDAHRWMRPDAQRWIRPDVARFLKPGADPVDVFPALDQKYSPNQPRVPAGRPGGGRWSSGREGGDGGGGAGGISPADGAEGGIDGDAGEPSGIDGFTSDTGNSDGSESADVFDNSTTSESPEGDGTRGYDDRLASSDKPSPGRAAMLGIMARAAARVMEAYRSENFLFDLFGNREGAVAVTTIDDTDIFGSNSTSSTYTSADTRAATALRDNLIAKYPEVMNIDNIGGSPNNALFHAETNVLTRAAEASGGTLEGKSLEIYIDRIMCPNCRSIVPLVGLELGNPNLTYVDPNWITTIQNGSILSRSKR